MHVLKVDRLLLVFSSLTSLQHLKPLITPSRKHFIFHWLPAHQVSLVILQSHWLLLLVFSAGSSSFLWTAECWNSRVKMRQCSLSPLSFLSLFCHPTLLAILFKYGLYAIDFQIDISTWDSSLNSNSYIQLSNQHFHLHGQLMSTLAHPKWNPDLPFPGLSSPPFSSFPVAQAKSFKVQ